MKHKKKVTRTRVLKKKARKKTCGSVLKKAKTRRRKTNPHAHKPMYLLCVQKKHGPRMYYVSTPKDQFTNNAHAHRFASISAAQHKAQSLMAQFHKVLNGYLFTIEPLSSPKS